VTAYRLDGWGLILIFSLHQSMQTDSGSHTASSIMGTGGSSPGVKRLGLEGDNSLPYSAEVKNDVAVPPLPHTSSRRGA
jgi:hypothetical protein